MDLQNVLIKQTTVEKTIPYFLCGNYTSKEHLFIIGKPNNAQKMLFKAAGLGKEGFDKAAISIGECFILDENRKKVLCLYPNSSLSRGKEKPILRIFKQLRQTSLKKIDEVRWLTSPLMLDAQDPSKVENTVDENSEQPFQINQENIAKRAENLKKDIEKFNTDIKQRYENEEAVINDAAFIKELRKAGLLFLAQLARTDEETKSDFSSLKGDIEAGLPEWKKLEAKIHLNSNKTEQIAVLKESLKKVVKTMDERKSEIETILKRVNPEALS